MVKQKKAEIGVFLSLNDENQKLIDKISNKNREDMVQQAELAERVSSGVFERHIVYIQSLNNYAKALNLYEDIQAILEEENRDLRQQVRSLKNEIENLQDKIDDMTEPSDEGMEQTLEEM